MNTHGSTEQLEQITISIPTDSNDVLGSLVLARRLKGRQAIIEPLVVEHARNFGPTAIQGLEALLDTLQADAEGPNTENRFRQTDWRKLIQSHQETLNERFPLKPIDPEDELVKIGIRVPSTAMLIYRTLAILEGHTQVGPRIVSLVNGHTHLEAQDAAKELSSFAQQIFSQ